MECFGGPNDIIEHVENMCFDCVYRKLTSVSTSVFEAPRVFSFLI